MIRVPSYVSHFGNSNSGQLTRVYVYIYILVHVHRSMYIHIDMYVYTYVQLCNALKGLTV